MMLVTWVMHHHKASQMDGCSRWHHLKNTWNAWKFDEAKKSCFHKLSLVLWNPGKLEVSKQQKIRENTKWQTQNSKYKIWLRFPDFFFAPSNSHCLDLVILTFEKSAKTCCVKKVSKDITSISRFFLNVKMKKISSLRFDKFLQNTDRQKSRRSK